MKNKNVGYLVVGISFLMGVIILIFNKGLVKIVEQSCTHGSSCTMYDTIRTQTYLSLAIAGVILAIGLFLIFSKENEKIVIKKVIKRPSRKKISLRGLSEEEKKVIKILEKENGAVFQKSLAETLGIGKVKMTRLMDKLEAKQLIERKRRGMNNIIVLKS